jgi:hypothetical protein
MTPSTASFSSSSALTGATPARPARSPAFIRSYILNNHLKEFVDYREKNSITVFDENLGVRTEYYHTARILLAVFLREALRADSMVHSGGEQLDYTLQ